MVTKRSIRRRNETRIAVIALMLIGALLIVELHGLRRDRDINAAIRVGALTTVAAHETALGRLARATIAQSEGRLDDALDHYVALSGRDTQRVGKAVRFNLGTLYLERAVVHERREEEQLWISLVEQAKENYRSLIAEDPEQWDARYNLSRALEMLPDLPEVQYGDEVNPERAPEAPQASSAQDRLP